MNRSDFECARPQLDPNNIRNRYRRYRAAMIAYNFYLTPFRDWLRAARPDSYSENPWERKVTSE